MPVKLKTWFRLSCKTSKIVTCPDGHQDHHSYSYHLNKVSSYVFIFLFIKLLTWDAMNAGRSPVKSCSISSITWFDLKVWKQIEYLNWVFMNSCVPYVCKICVIQKYFNCLLSSICYYILYLISGWKFEMQVLQ